MRELIIADNQDIAILGIKFLINTLPTDISKVSVVGNKRLLIDLLIINPQALIIIDYSFLDFSGVDEMLIVRSRFSASDWILFSEELDDEFLRQTVFNEASFSIILKASSSEEISAAISLTARKERFICSQIATHLLNSNRETVKSRDKLTNTEREILKDIASGKTTKEIAFIRCVSIHTITSHRKNIFRKIAVNNVYEATKYAVRAGIVDVSDYYI